MPCLDAFPKPFQIEDIQIPYSCPLLKLPEAQILPFDLQNLVFWCLPKAISNRRYSNILLLILQFYMQSAVFWCLQKGFQIEDIQLYYSCPPLKAQIRDFYVQNSVFWCDSRHFKHSKTLSLPTPESQDSPILCAKLGVFMPSQRHFNPKIFKYIIPAHPSQCRFANFVQNLVFSCLAKIISNRRYSNILFLPIPKGISNRRYLNMLFLPAPESPDSLILYAKIWCFEAFPKAF